MTDRETESSFSDDGTEWCADEEEYQAKVLGISTSTLKNKLSGRTDFKVSEADTLSSLLGLTPAQRDLCFFCGGRR